MNELNILVDVMENHIGLHYTTHIVNFHRRHKVLNGVCKSTGSPDFLDYNIREQKSQHMGTPSPQSPY